MSNFLRKIRPYIYYLTLTFFVGIGAYYFAMNNFVAGVLCLVIAYDNWIYESLRKKKEKLERDYLEKVGLAYAYSLCFPPGELIDRLTIIELKIDALGVEDPRRLKLSGQAFLLEGLIGQATEDMAVIRKKPLNKLIPTVQDFQVRMEVLNKRQWEWEDKVRSKDSSEATYAAVRARMNNNLRTSLKNEINDFFGFDHEVKKYSGE